MKVKLALIQMAVLAGEVASNLEKARRYVEKAANQNADIVIFPEDFLTGPVGKHNNGLVDFDNQFRKEFQSLARKFSIDIVSGSWIEGGIYGWQNVSYYIDHKGGIKGRYCKVNLWKPERAYLTPGNSVCVFNSKFGRVGLSICWDLMFPEFFRRLTHRGVKLVFCPSYWITRDAGIGLKWNKKSEKMTVNSLCTARAVENGVAFIFVNAAGFFHYPGQDPDPLIGQTQITLPFQGCIKRVSTNKECMLLQEIDLAILNDAERAYKIRSDLTNGILQ